MQELNMNLIIAFNEHFFVYFTLAILRELRGKWLGAHKISLLQSQQACSNTPWGSKNLV